MVSVFNTHLPTELPCPHSGSSIAPWQARCQQKRWAPGASQIGSDLPLKLDARCAGGDALSIPPTLITKPGRSRHPMPTWITHEEVPAGASQPAAEECDTAGSRLEWLGKQRPVCDSHQRLGLSWGSPCVLLQGAQRCTMGTDRGEWLQEGRVTLEVSESQVVEWVRQMSPEAKQEVLRVLIPRLDAFEALVDYGSQRMRALSDACGLDWDNMTEQERERLIDELLHQDGT